MEPNKARILERLEKRTTKDPTTGCWLWTGALSWGGKSEGYGRMFVMGSVYYVHRLSAWIFLGMPISRNIDAYTKDYQALHRTECPNKNCWNPDHLYIGTHMNNMNDRDGV